MELFSYYDTDSILDHCMTARVPFGVILREMIALETRGTERLPIAALSRATDIQKELIVIDLIRRDVEAGGPYREIIEPAKLGNLATLNAWLLIAPPGQALAAFRERFLKQRDLDLSPLLHRAAQLQTTNHVPASVPPMGAIYTSAQTGIGRDGGAIVDHFALNAALLVQSACRALVEPSERGGMSIAKVYDSDPVPLRKAQELANRLLVERRSRTPAEAAIIRDLMQIAGGWLLEAGFRVYAQTVVNLLDQPRGPLSSFRLEAVDTVYDRSVQGRHPGRFDA